MSGIPKNGHPAPEPQPVPVVQPGPVPFTVQCDLVMHNGTPMIQLRWFTPTGVQILFMTTDDARNIANLIADKAGGLVVPTSKMNGGC